MTIQEIKNKLREEFEHAPRGSMVRVLILAMLAAIAKVEESEKKR